MVPVFWLVLLAISSSVGLRLNTGAYEDLILEIGTDIPAERCKDILNNLEITLGSSSQYLFSALDGRAYVKTATVLLPSTWSDECLPNGGPALSATGQTADVTLVPKGQPVWTQQSAGCGQAGDRIYLNYNSLLEEDTSTLSRVFIKEFAKYRYGVFDEQGFLGDTVYPVCYPKDDTGLSVTGCSDLPIRDNGICNNEQQKNFTDMLDEKARTSIMFGAAAPSVTMFCDEGNHDRYAPNKHNFMCERRSALDVILQHPDFLTADHRSNGGQQITNTTPAVTYRRRTLTRYVLIVEDTQEMLVRESWTYLRNAVRKWAVYDLPANTEVALIMMNESSASVLLQPTALHNHTARDVLASNIPYTPGDGRAPSCIQCALQEALTMLERSTELRGPASSVILLIAPGTKQDTKAIEQAKRAASAGVRIATVNYPGVLRPTPLDILAEMTQGPAYTVQERKHNIDTSLLTTYFQLTNVLYAIAEGFQEFDGPSPGMPVEIHRRELTDDYRSSVTGSFVLDESMAEPARFLLFTHNVESPLIRSVTLWSPSQVAYTKRSDSMLVVKIITLAAPISEPGTWTYRIDRWSGNPQPHYVQVMASAKPESSNSVVRARFWITRPRPGLFLLRAEVKRGALPVLGARLEVVITRPEFNGTQAFKDKFELLDTGSGDPDVTKGDGIYTRYWNAGNTGPGAYTFEVTATDNGNTAYSSLEGPEEPCCGSKTPKTKVEPLQPFQRVPPPVTIQVTAEDALAALQVAAGRVGDLRSQVFALEKRVRLTWSSPDMAGFSASRYEVRYAHSVQDITDGFETSATPWEHGQPFPLAAGSEISFTLNLTENERLLGRPIYLAVKSYAGSGDSQSGLVSNWVRVLVPKPTPPPATAPPDLSTIDYTAWPYPDIASGPIGIEPSIPGMAHRPEFGVQLIIPIVIGAILLLLLLTLYCYFCVLRKRGRHDGKAAKSKSDKLQSAITIVPSSPAHSNVPIQNIQQPDPEQHAYTNELHTVGVPINYPYDDEPKKRYSLVQQQEQQLIEELKQQQQQYGTVGGMNVSVISGGGTLQRNGRTLSPYESWSASQLLHEHERRHSPMDEMLQPPPQQYTDQYGNSIGVPPPVPPLPSYNGYPVNYSIYGVHPSQQLVYHQPPPPFNVSLQGSVSSVNSADKKKRNVTMV